MSHYVTIDMTNLHENVDDGSISENIYYPEEEVGDANEVVDERVLRRELFPVLVNNVQKVVINPVK